MTLTDGIERFAVQLEADGRSPHTRRTYRRHLDAFARWAGHDTAVVDITPDRLARFLTSDDVRMRADAEGAGPRAAITVNQVKSALRAFFRYLVEVGTLATSPARAVRSARTSSDLPQVLTQDEAARLLSTIAAATGPLARRDHVLFSLLLGTGIRLSAAVGLDVADLRLDARRMTITGKGGRRDAVILNQRLVALLGAYVAGLGAGPVFRNGRGGRLGGRQVQLRLTAWLDAAGIAKVVTPHCMRHSFGVRLYAQTRDLRIVQRALHHASVTTTELYTHLADDGLERALEAM